MADIRSAPPSVASAARIAGGAAIVFDFDGTIADSFPVALHIAHELFGWRFSKDDISRLRGMKTRQILHELRVPLWRAPFLAARIRRRMVARMDQIPIIPGLDESIRRLAGRYKLFVLSSNSAANVRTFLRRYDIDAPFAAVYGSMLPWHKARVLRRLMRRHGLVKADVRYVGDTDMDIAAAHHAGTAAVAVAWGYSNIHVLQRHHPEALVFTPDELEEYFMGKHKGADRA